MKYYISYDLGTGGVKASLYDEDLHTLGKSFIEYPTYYPKDTYHEQRPEDWWNGVVQSTKKLLAETGVSGDRVACLALSGHSCVAVPIDDRGKLLMPQVPIWSDTRAQKEAEDFFNQVDYNAWYLSTGNGFPAACYCLFKLMWLRRQDPELFARIHTVLGSKDYINFRLTGKALTDFSYASSFGAYDLQSSSLREEFLQAADIPLSIFPDIVPSHTIVGTVSETAAKEIGLSEHTKVACGGVDNACMALGAVGAAEGKAYVSLGSSSWVPVNSSVPVLDTKTRPYVFAHIAEGMFTSAYSIFAGGSSFQWIRNQLCRDFAEEPDAYIRMSQMAADVPLGSNGILFNPSLAGGTSQDKSVHIRGAFVGLHLGTTREEMIRAAMEGIALNLRMSLDLLAQKVPLEKELLFCGGGSKSPFWMQMFSDIFDMDVIKTNIDQDAASLGAAAICVRADGKQENYDFVPALHHLESRCKPNAEAHEQYEKLLAVFRHVSEVCADLGEYMKDSRK